MDSSEDTPKRYTLLYIMARTILPTTTTAAAAVVQLWQQQQQQQQQQLHRRTVFVAAAARRLLFFQKETRQRQEYRYGGSGCGGGTWSLRSSLSQQSSSWTVNPETGRVSHPRSRHVYQVKVGLELHAQLHIPTKLFSNAPNGAQAASSTWQQYHPNALVHPYDVAVPGWYPTAPSKEAVQCAILVAAALQCRDIATSRFERKHYLYADLPHGYQVTQQRWPLARHGMVVLSDNENDKNTEDQAADADAAAAAAATVCRIDRIQLEQDTAKTTTYTTTTDTGTIVSRVDANRAGVALVEIVTHPDLCSAAQAAACVATIQALLQHSRTSLAQLQHGHLRVDVNVNIYVPIEIDMAHGNPAALPSHPRVEIKNVNSLQHVHDCIQYEAVRQAHVLEQCLLATSAESSVLGSATATPSSLGMETRTWNASTRQTEWIRNKDSDADYRFLPEPDLPLLVLDDSVLNGCATVAEFIARHLPELPRAVRHRWQRDCQLPFALCRVLSLHVATVEFYDAAMKAARTSDYSNTDTTTTDTTTTTTTTRTKPTVANTALLTANLLANELFGLVKKHFLPHPDHVDHPDGTSASSTSDHDVSMETSHVTPRQLGTVVRMVQEGLVSNTMAKALLSILYTEYPKDTCPRQVATERHWTLIVDAATLSQLCHHVISLHPDEVRVYHRGGKFVAKMLKLFTGKVMAASRGQAHPERLAEVLAECLANTVVPPSPSPEPPPRTTQP
jgi:aspartyl-tRNA(Asn)/glutamyl-tRNA(Gln) amidotransferase subunit B